MSGGVRDWTVANSRLGQPTYPADLGRALKKTHGTQDFGSLLCDNCNRCAPATHWCPTHKWVFCNACNLSAHSSGVAAWHKRTRIDENTPTTLGSVVHTWAFVVALDEDLKRTVWNSTVQKMMKTKGPTDHTGLTHATVDSRRTDPHVAMITRGVPPSQIWEYLQDLNRSAVDPHKLLQILMAFVPFSVVRSDDAIERVLILPMGMQKTNGGRGINKDGKAQFKPLEGVLGGLFGAISLKFPTMAVLTAFSGGTSKFKTVETLDTAPAIALWKLAFGENLSYFWREFNRNGLTSQQPGRGGPTVNGDNLEITNNDGTVIFHTQIIKGGPIDFLMSTGPTTYLGTILCGWT
jgi:hypothetical protein